MIILHLGVTSYQFLLWGECSNEHVETSDADHAEASARLEKSTAPRKHKSNSKALAMNPFDAGPERLIAAISDLSLLPRFAPREATTCHAWLPTVKDAPIASSVLIAPLPEALSAVRIAPWGVTAIALDRNATALLLCHCIGQKVLGAGIIIGQDLAFWAMAMQFAGSLVARQQFMPSLAKTDDAFQARWQPSISGKDAETLADLAKAMPEAARALSLDPTHAPASPPSEILRDTVSILLDWLIRFPSRPEPPKKAPRFSPKKRANLQNFDSIHDQWIHALQSPDGTMTGEPEELAQLAAQVEQWQRPILMSTQTSLRLCFRLEEGEADDPQAEPVWSVRYLLQGIHDPSLLIPVKEAWAAKGHVAAIFKQQRFSAREYLLQALGQASRICPRIEASLKSPAPAGYKTDTAGANDFLTHRATLLEQAGFGVLLPAWWTRKGTKLHLSARAVVKTPIMSGGGGLSLNDALRFDWEIALGEEKLSFGELEALANAKSPLVRLRGQWVQMNAGEIQTALEFWKKRQSGQATAREVIQMALGGAAAPAGIAFEGVSASGWMGDLLEEIKGDRQWEALPVPAGFEGTLRPYQLRGYSWLAFLRRWGLGACLADDMGLGKTIQALTLILRDWLEGKKRPVLLICPTSVTGNWQKEASRFTPQLPVLVHHGIARTKGEAFGKEAANAAIVISSYALLPSRFRYSQAGAMAGGDPGRSAEHQEPRNEAGAGRAGSERGISHRFDRHARGKQCGRSLVHHGVSQSGISWNAIQLSRKVFRANPGESRRPGGGALEASDRSIHPAPAQDGQEGDIGPAGKNGDEGLLHAHARAGRRSMPPQ